MIANVFAKARELLYVLYFEAVRTHVNHDERPKSVSAAIVISTDESIDMLESWYNMSKSRPWLGVSSYEESFFRRMRLSILKLQMLFRAGKRPSELFSFRFGYTPFVLKDAVDKDSA